LGVVYPDQAPLGYVPDPLVELLDEIKAAKGYDLAVELANPAEAGYHFRLLAPRCSHRAGVAAVRRLPVVDHPLMPQAMPAASTSRTGLPLPAPCWR
jgi:hypothetical protein